MSAARRAAADPARRSPDRAGRQARDAARLVPMSVADGGQIDLEPERVAEWLREDPEAQVIDVREPGERDAGHIAGTRHIELAALSSQAETVARDRRVVFYCRVGSRSLMAAQAFRASGYEAYSMAGGLVRWAREGRPLSPEGGRVAEH
jgi:rhodanese-related sulfurtransferase